MNEIGARARKVLHAVVSEYLATGDAVGSETLTRRYSLEVSPATVRTSMGDLEQLGLLRHAHTSGGRIPTDRGLRYYVDTLLRVRSLTPAEKDRIRDGVGPVGDAQEVLPRVAKLLRELSQLAVVVAAPRAQSDPVSHIEFVKLREGQLLAVIATSSGHVQNKLVPVDFVLGPGDLERVNNYLNSLIAGLTLDQVRARLVREIEDERAGGAAATRGGAGDPLLARGLELAATAVSADGGRDILVDGQANLVAAAEDLDGVRRVLRQLEDKDLMVKLLDRTLAAEGICVFIGAEANLADVTDISVVAASYGGEDRPLGTIGVIGPSRMNYSKVIPLVDFTADVIGEVLPKL